MASTAIGFMTQDEPRYREVLRTIGWHLDSIHAAYVTLCEIDEGYIWHCFARGDLTRPVSDTISHADLAGLSSRLRAERTGRNRLPSHATRAARPAKSAPRRPVCAYGYQETFRTIGARLDRMKARAVLVVERDDTLIINYQYPVPGYLRRDLFRLAQSHDMAQDAFGHKQLVDMVEAARRNRNYRYYRG